MIRARSVCIDKMVHSITTYSPARRGAVRIFRKCYSDVYSEVKSIEARAEMELVETMIDKANVIVGYNDRQGGR